MDSQNYLNIIKQQIEEFDQEFKNSSKRKEMNWKVHQKIVRNISTLQGKVKVKITRYRKIINNNQVLTFFAPGLQKYYLKNKVIQKDINDKILNLYVNSSISTRTLSKNFNISHQTVKNILNNAKIENKKTDYSNLAKNKSIIYLEADDTFKKTKYGTKFAKMQKFRMITLHLGKNEKNKIIGKFTLIESNRSKQKTIEEWTNLILSTIKTIYGKTDFQILVFGDGAKWIKKLSFSLNAVLFLDRFHIFFNAFKAFGYSQTKNKSNFLSLQKFEKQENYSIYQKFKNYILNFQFEAAIDFLNHLSKQKILFKKYADFKKMENYLKNNYDPKIQKFKNSFIGNHTEIFVSHFKKIFKRQFAIFDLTTIKKITLLNQKHILFI